MQRCVAVRRWRWLLVALVLGTFGVQLAEARDSVEDLPWVASFAVAKATARQQRKLVGVYFYDKSRTSKRFGDRTLAHKAVRPRLAAKFVLTRIMKGSRDPLIGRHDVKKFPSFWFFTAAGRPLKAITGSVKRDVFAKQITEVLQRFQSAPVVPRPPVNPNLNGPPPSGTTGFGAGTKPAPKTRVRESQVPAAVTRGLAWLAGKQQSNGSWVRARIYQDKRRTSSLDLISVALTATSGLALLSGGSSLTTGPHARRVRKALSFLKGAIRADGIVSDAKENDDVHQLYTYFQTPLAALFLAECLALKDDARLREKLATVAAAIAKGQGTDGGWGYGLSFKQNDPSTVTGWTLTATTAGCVLALARLDNVGIPVDASAIAKGVAYLARTRAGTGYAYGASRRMFPYPAAAAMVALVNSATGGAESPDGLRARKYLRTYFRRIGTALGKTSVPTVGRYEPWGRLWCALAMAREGARGGEAWRRFIRDYALSEQNADGSWTDAQKKGGDQYVTATNLIALTASAGHLAVSAPLPRPPAPAITKKPRYLDPGDAESRLKVFRVSTRQHARIRYGVDWVASCSGPLPTGYAKGVAKGLSITADHLFDLTEGQVYVRTITVYPDRREYERADFRFSSETKRYGVHGMTAKRRAVRRGVTTNQPIGLYIECPQHLPLAIAGSDWRQTGGGWQTSAGAGTLAHEVGHYLFGLPDEYSEGDGSAHCPKSLMAGSYRGVMEFCTKKTHADRRHPDANWTMMKRLYPNLVVPTEPLDEGPFQAPEPKVTVVPAKNAGAPRTPSDDR